MAWVFTIDDGTTTLNLLSATDYVALMGSIIMSPPTRTLTWAGSRNRDGSFPAFAHFENREIVLNIRLEGTSVDDLVSNFNNLQKMLNQATRYFISGGAEGTRATLKLTVNGATNQVQWYILVGDVDPSWSMTSLTAGSTRVILAKLRLTCFPFAEEPSDVVVTNNNQANSGIDITLTGVRGEVETPTKFSLDTDQNLSSDVRFWVARRSRGTVANFIPYMEGEAGTFTGYDTVDIGGAQYTYSFQASATARSGVFGRQTASGAADIDRLFRWKINTNIVDNCGQFRVFIRMKHDSGSSKSFYMYYGIDSTPTKIASNASFSVANGTTWRVLDCGVVTFPDISVSVGVVPSALYLELGLVAAANSVLYDVDYIMLVPIDEGYITGTLTSLAVDSVVVVDGMGNPPSVYTTVAGGTLISGGSPLPSSLTGVFPTLAPGNNRILCYLGQVVDDVLADTRDIVITYRPRYSWIRGA